MIEDRPYGALSDRTRLVALLGVRLLLSLLLLAITGWILLRSGAHMGSFTPKVMSICLIITFLSSIGFLVWLQTKPDSTWIAKIQIALDLVLSAVLIYTTGGLTSEFTFLFGIHTLMAAVWLGPRASRTAVVASLLMLVPMGICLANGWVARPPDQPASEFALSAKELSAALLVNVVGLLLVGVLSDVLAGRLLRARKELRKLTTQATHLARLNDDIIRSLTSGLVTTNEEGLITFANPAALHILRATMDQLEHQPITRILRKSDRASSRIVTPRDDDDAQITGGRIDGHAVRGDGSIFPIGYMRTPLFDHHEAVNGSMIVFRDLSEVVALREAAERAEKLAMLGRVSAGLAHEIRNPLSSISGSVQLVRESKSLGTEDQHLLAIIQREVERLNELVTTMLDVSRPKHPQLQSFALVDVVRDVVDIAQSGLTKEREVTIALIGDERFHIFGDPGQIRQVMWNLIKNAYEVSPHGACIHIYVQQESDIASIRVEDEGPGVAPEDQARIFDMFYSRRGAHGTGLGLALVKQIIDAHHGIIRVSNHAGGGAEFSISLPLHT